MRTSNELEHCLNWVIRRETARLRKEDGFPYPYIADQIITKFRFCNVRREDDRVTIWIRKHIREAFAGHPRLWWMLCASRQINWPWTLMMLIGDESVPEDERIYDGAWPSELGDGKFTPQLMADALNDLASMSKIFTAAYIITAPSTKGAKKTDHVALKTLGALWEDREVLTEFFNECGWLEQAHKKLMTYDGWGPFLAYQAVVDMRFTPLLDNAGDITSWAAAGPGTLRGLNRLLGRPIKQSMSQAEARDHIVDLWPQLMNETGVTMDLTDVPNVLCETDKYLRAINGEGTPKQIYKPSKEPMP